MKKSEIVLGLLLFVVISSCDFADKSKLKEKIHVRRSETEQKVSAENQDAGNPEESDSLIEEDAYIEEESYLGEDNAYLVVEDMPEFPGGTNGLMKYLSDAICYPEAAARDGIQGRVTVSFIVDKNGKIRNAEVVRGIDELLDKEALRVVNAMPPWQAGKQKGKNVDVKYTLPIRFTLP